MGNPCPSFRFTGAVLHGSADLRACNGPNRRNLFQNGSATMRSRGHLQRASLRVSIWRRTRVGVALEAEPWPVVPAGVTQLLRVWLDHGDAVVVAEGQGEASGGDRADGVAALNGHQACSPGW